jgi:membrane protein DedA with SNARE-associated domain
VLHDAFSSNAYILLFLAILVEEDAAILPAAFLVHQGRMRFAYVLPVCVAASFLLHLVLYVVSLRWGREAFAKRAQKDSRCAWLQSSFQSRYQSWLILSRFLWGLRYPIVSIAALANIKFWEFLILDAVGCVLWALFMLIIGFYFGDAIEAMGQHLRHYDHAIAAGLSVAVLLGILIYKRRQQREGLIPTEACEIELLAHMQGESRE